MKITKKHIRWPRMNDEGVWRPLDEDLFKIYRKGKVEAKLESLCTLVHAISLDHFGEEKKASGERMKQANRRQVK